MTGFLARLLWGTTQVRQRPDWPEFAGANWTERIMDLEVTDRFHAKQGRSTGRLVLHKEQKRYAVYLKRHYRLRRLHGLLATLWPGADWSPAFQEWSHLAWARQAGLPVPGGVAALQRVGPWGRLQSMLAVEELTDMLPLHEAIPLAARRLEPRVFQRWKRTLVIEMARLARGLHQHRRFHKDFYLCHFYVPTEDTGRLPDWRGRVHLIDLHRLGHHPWTWPFWRMKDLAQLLYSSEVEGVTDSDRLRFWNAYFGRNRKRLGTRFLGWCIGVQSGRYRSHNEKRTSRQRSAA